MMEPSELKALQTAIDDAHRAMLADDEYRRRLNRALVLSLSQMEEKQNG